MKEIIRRSLRKRLLALMSEISEEHYCAGWLDGLEHRLWQAVLQYPEPYEFGFGPVANEQVEELRALAEELQEWGIWADEAKQEKLISLAEWQQIFHACEHPAYSIGGKAIEQ
jgi:hypothetical protein